MRCRDASLTIAVMPAKAGIQSNQIGIQIVPLRICLLDQFQLPASLPFFDRLLPCNRGDHALMRLVPYQFVNAVAFGESFDKVALMLPHALDHVGGHTNVECSVPAADEDVNTRFLRHERTVLDSGACPVPRYGVRRNDGPICDARGTLVHRRLH